jgi:hypothetical protein
MDSAAAALNAPKLEPFAPALGYARKEAEALKKWCGAKASHHRTIVQLTRT